MARVLILHGASSSGKSTLIQAIRAQSPVPLLHLSFDHLRDSHALDLAAFTSKGADWQSHRSKIFSGLHRAVAGFAEAGNDLILEHILDSPGWHNELQKLLADHAIFFVCLHTSLPQLEAREAARGNRAAGSAKADAAHIHGGLTYDLELSGEDAPDINARKLLRHWATHTSPSAFFTGRANGQTNGQTR
ncbi:chloramphenicol phosphotransferase CPT family protein [Pseudoruegeria sp. SHC-113]|uniref:chloramphenicol phosphotransferase CPT family protein n=1 Tax=Pseudoruegeria sp. SHC-113 TaxID=2855439 RepID=UPI0021BB427F|nr:chloramphenicol phosphotransferase CPT family protein [Pseudoruegeria sp. SHC-113]MCT8158744.1 chloramphenicol phosphotransferase CPT family protein [Pseudoruegeria sp. SHC-113]